jgi:hypothetical protein
MAIFPLSRRAIAITLAASAIAACSDSTGPGGGPSIRLLRGSSVSDTVGTTLTQALVVEVHDSSGAPAPEGTLVRFETINSEPAQVYAHAQGSVNNIALTDAAGHASAIVTLGARPGVGHLAVTVPSLGMVEYATYTIMVGNAAHTVITPADTGLYIGNALTLHATVVDRFNNARSDAITWSGPTPGLSVSNAGVVTGSAFGRYYVKATANGVTDSAVVRVLPRGRIAGVAGRLSLATMSLLDTDGSNLTTPVQASGVNNPKWLPGTTSLVYEQNLNVQQALYRLSADGTTKLFLSPVPATMTRQSEPAPSADGKWVYFTAFDSRCAGFCVARAASDGSNVEIVIASHARTPSPSPDGSKFAYVEEFTNLIRVFDVATQTASTWSVAGNGPAWSPDGTQIAYATSGGTIAIIRPDGTPVRTLPASAGAAVIYSWSPDGKWILNGGALVDAVTGESLSLQYRSRGMTVTTMK